MAAGTSASAACGAQFSGLAAGDYYQVGDGRAVVLPAEGKLRYQAGFEEEVDYRAEEWGRALLWAARREPRTRLDLSVASEELPRHTLPAPATVSWSKAIPGTQIEVALRRWDGVRTPLGGTDCSTPSGSVAMELPLLRAGDYHLDAIATRAGAVESWGTEAFTVVDPRTVEAVHLDRDWGEAGESLSGSVTLSGPGQTDHRVQVRLMDRQGRILVQNELEARSDSIRFGIPVEPWMPMLLRVEAVLLAAEEEVASTYS